MTNSRPSSPVNNNNNTQNNNNNTQNNNTTENSITVETNTTTSVVGALTDVSYNNLTLNETIHGEGFIVTNQQGTTANGNEVTHTTFVTIDTSDNVMDITQNLTETVTEYYDNVTTGETSVLLDQIKLYAGRIQCSDFHGKGTIDDYSELFVAAAKIANESKQIQLNVDVEGFEEFGKAADDLSALFNSFIIKLQNVSIIDDTSFLRSVAIALEKIWNLSETFGRFKDTILATSTVKLPKSAHDASIILSGVMSEVNCALNYVNHFVNPGTENLPDAELSPEDKHIIDSAVSTIDNWNILCSQGVTIAMTNNVDIQNIKLINTEFKTKTDNIKLSTNLLKSKLAQYNIRF